MLGRVMGMFFGIATIAGVLLFGGLLVPKTPKKANIKTVELFSDDLKKAEEKKLDQPEPEKPPEELQAQKDQPPDISDATPAPQVSDNTPALDAASLSSIEAALNPGAGGGEFGSAVSLASGGRIGGTGKAGARNGGDNMDNAFSMDDIDQKPRPIVQTPPVYPSELKGKKMGGSVQVVFIVTATGHVLNARVDRASHPAFGAPALAAVRQWKFEPAVKGGVRVKCLMRVPIRFEAG
ncbi:MAG: TonB family protein [bacterium]